MAADRIDSRAARDIASHLNRIAGACERIADALEAANANDPVGLIEKALAQENVGKVVPDPTERGANLPESERWRLG